MSLCIRLLTSLFCLAFLAVPPVWAQSNMYVTDQLQVTVRSGPSVENKVIHVVKSGDRVEVLSGEQDGWIKVRADEDKEGWMIARYLQAEMPAIIKIKKIDPQNKTLLARLEDLTKDNQELKTSLGKAQGRVAELESSYTKLEKDASDVLALRNSHKKLQDDYAAQKKRLGNLSTEVESLRLGGNLKWFLAGAGVLLAGWLIGLAMGRRKRRSSSSLY
jgi:SH3 domain protein